MNIFRQYFQGSAIFAVLAIVAGFILGGPQGALIVGLLGVLETSLSFDNAVVNSKYLDQMDPVWRHRFITFGVPVAVFGMRLLFPLLIVAVVAGMNPVAVLMMAIRQPAQYAATLTSAHNQVAAFGGAFLLMVFLKYFIDENKENHWIGFLEEPLHRLGRIEAIQMALTLVVVLLAGMLTGDAAHNLSFVQAGVGGIVTYILSDSVGVLLGAEEGDGAVVAAKAGLAGLLYLELLDASFSFDGVIGAFALSNNLFIIALGLGVGAFFVRSMTLLLVDKGTLNKYRYLEHGAFWAIGALAASMFVGVRVDIPDYVTGLMGAVLIGLAFLSSLRSNKLQAANQASA